MAAVQNLPPGSGISGERLSEAAGRPRLLLAALGLCFVATLAIHWPGELTPDSLSQLQQARSGNLTDWHPPIMAAIWEIWPRPATMLLIQAALHWFGIGCLASLLLSRGAVRAAWAMLFVGFLPIAWKYVGVIGGDSLLAAVMIAAFGIASRSRIAAFLLSVVAGLVRANGPFAVAPLWPYLTRSRSRMLRAVAGAAALLLIPAAMLANSWIFHAERTGVERSLQLYDLAGIAYFSGDHSVLPVAVDDLDRCYTPLFWDTLRQGRCGQAWDRMPDDVWNRWLSAIARHPVAYAAHRLDHFNREIFFLVPAMQQCADASEMHRCDISKRGYAVDFVAKNPLFWPVSWLIVGLFLLVARPEPLTRSLCLSGLVYGFGYLAVGVAADFRYFYWTELAIPTALVLHFGAGDRLPAKWLTIVLSAVWIAGYAARYAAFV